MALSIACISSSCTTMNSTTYVPPKVSFDSTIAMASLDGFRIQMSTRMAKQVAKERGYNINSRYSYVTFDDIIEAGPIKSIFGPSIQLERDNKTIELGFEYGKVKSVTHKHMFYQRQQAEELLASYLKRYPQLELSKEDSNLQVYKYNPNKRAWLYASIQMFGENVHQVSVSIYDGNYAQSKSNLELYEKLDAIRRGY